MPDWYPGGTTILFNLGQSDKCRMHLPLFIPLWLLVRREHWVLLQMPFGFCLVPIFLSGWLFFLTNLQSMCIKNTLKACVKEYINVLPSHTGILKIFFPFRASFLPNLLESSYVVHPLIFLSSNNIRNSTWNIYVISFAWVYCKVWEAVSASETPIHSVKRDNNLYGPFIILPVLWVSGPHHTAEHWLLVWVCVGEDVV